MLFHILARGFSVSSVRYAFFNDMFTQEHFSFEVTTGGMNIAIRVLGGLLWLDKTILFLLVLADMCVTWVGFAPQFRIVVVGGGLCHFDAWFQGRCQVWYVHF